MKREGEEKVYKLRHGNMPNINNLICFNNE